jgi:hypothetical protein
MAVKRRRCAIGMIPHAPGEPLSTPWGDASLPWLLDGTAAQSIASSWRDTTAGLVDIGPLT